MGKLEEAAALKAEGRLDQLRDENKRLVSENETLARQLREANMHISNLIADREPYDPSEM